MKGIAQRDAEVLRVLPVRLATAVLGLGVGISGAAVLRGIRVRTDICPGPMQCSAWLKPGWADPGALVLCLLGVAAAACVLLAGRRADPPRPGDRRVPLVGVVLLATSLLCLWLKNHDWMFLMRSPHIVMWPNPAWALPTAFCVGVVGATLALLIYYRPHKQL